MKISHNKSQPSIGVTGKRHLSEAEAKASFSLHPFGWIPCEEKFPMTFTDADGTTFRACPDFYHPATGFYAEFKTEKLNGRGSKNAADTAMEKIDSDIAYGFIKAKDRGYKALQNAWNHSIQKIAACSKQLPNNTPLVLIYEKEQDLNEERRCARNGVFMLSLDNISGFHLFLRMASIGLDVGFSRNGFSFKNEPC